MISDSRKQVLPLVTMLQEKHEKQLQLRIRHQANYNGLKITKTTNAKKFMSNAIPIQTKYILNIDDIIVFIRLHGYIILIFYSQSIISHYIASNNANNNGNQWIMNHSQ